MKTKLTSIITAIALLITGLGFALPAYAAEADSICDNPNISDTIKSASGCDENGGDVATVVINIINVVMGIIGVIAVIVIIIGGIQYMTSAGDTGKVQKAKDTILYAAIGLAIVILAAVIVNFVIAVVIKANT